MYIFLMNSYYKNNFTDLDLNIAILLFSYEILV